MPSLRTSIVNASFLCFALVMGEYTISSILLYGKTFPVWLVQLPSASGQVQAARPLLSLLSSSHAAAHRCPELAPSETKGRADP